MIRTVERILRRLFPELFAGYHLPMLARVAAISDAPEQGAIVDNYRPQFAVDIVILAQDGKPNPNLPRYNAVPLPLPMAGHHQGLWGFPQPGAIVEVAFAYANPNKPFIRAILSTDSTAPALREGDQIWQHSPGIHQTVDNPGNWQRHTDKTIEEKSTERLIKAVNALYELHSQKLNVATDSNEHVGGTKGITALGAMRMLAGEQALLLALQDLKIATNAVLHTYSKANTEITTDAQLRAVAKTLAHVEVTEGKVWYGSTDTNAVRVLLDLIAEVRDLADTLRTHTHGGPPPDQASDINDHKSNSQSLHDSLAPITE